MDNLLPGVALIRAGRRWQGWLAAIVVVALGVFYLWQFSDGRLAVYQERAAYIDRVNGDFYDDDSLRDFDGRLSRFNIISAWLWPLWGMWLVWAASLFSVRNRLAEYAHRPEFRCASAILCPGIVVAYAGKENGALLRYLAWFLVMSCYTVLWFFMAYQELLNYLGDFGALLMLGLIFAYTTWFLVLPMIGIYIALSAFKRTVYPIPQRQAAQ